MQDQQPSLKDLILEYLEIGWRRKLCFLPFPILVVAAFYYAMSLPPVYRSEGVLLVEDQNIPPELTRTTVTSYAAEQMEVIRQQLESTENVIGIINEFGLYQDSVGVDPVTLAQRFRAGMDVDTVNATILDPTSGGRRRVISIAFRVSFSDQSPEQAQKVAGELVRLFLERNASNRAREAAQTTSFLREEADILEQRVNELEDKLASFKTTNAKSLPELLQHNLDAITSAEERIRNNQLAIENLAEQEQLLSIELRSMDPYTGLPLGSAASTTENPGPQTTAALLSQKRAELAQLSTRYSESHPTIAGLRREITILEGQVVEENDGRDVAGEDLLSPIYLNLRYRIGSIERDIGSLTKENVELKLQVEDYNQRVAQTYLVEREYEELLRNYQASSARYEQLRNAQYEADVAQSLEEKSQVESLTVIEEPKLPRSPVGPDRFKVLFMGVCLAGVIPIGLVFIAEFLDERVRGKSSFERLFGQAALVIVPDIPSNSTAKVGFFQRRRIKYGLLVFAALAMLMAAAYFFVP